MEETLARSLQLGAERGAVGLHNVGNKRIMRGWCKILCVQSECGIASRIGLSPETDEIKQESEGREQVEVSLEG